MRFGPVVLFYKPEVLVKTICHLEQSGYIVHEFDCAAYQKEHEILNDIVLRIGGIENYGYKPGNPPRMGLDGFNDYINDVAVPIESGLVLVFKHFDAFHRQFLRYAHTTLDILAHCYHFNLLFGRRLITLVQTDGPVLEMDKVDAFSPWWNDKEWSRKDRLP